jgi:hypothetical protein
MNTKHLVSMLLFTSAALSQTASPSSVANMTPELMNKTINENALIPGGPVTLRKLVADAIALNRIDLIKTCFINPYTVGDALSAVAALPNNEVKQKAVIMMMRTPSTTCWPSEKLIMNMSGVSATGVIEPIISTIPSLLPGEVLTKEMVATQVARHKLADRLLAALMAQGATFTESEKALLSAPPSTTALNGKASPSQTMPPVPTQTKSIASAKSPSVAVTTQSAEAWPRYSLWLVVGAVAVTVLMYFVLRKPG